MPFPSTSSKSLIRHLALALALASCGGVDTPRPTEAASPIAVGSHPDDGLEDELLAVVGDRALLTLVLRRGRWSELRSALREMLAVEPPAELAALLDEPWKAPLLALGLFRVAEGWERLEGLELDRPIVVRLGEAPDDLAQAIRVARSEPEDSIASPLRHVIALPASDPTALSGAVRSLLERECGVGNEAGLHCRGWPVSVRPDDRWVWVVIGDDSAPLRTTATPEPALRWALDPRYPIAVHARFDALGRTVAHRGARLLRGTSLEPAPGPPDQLFPRTLSELLESHISANPVDFAFDQIAAAFRTDPPSLVFAAHLTHATTEALTPVATAEPAARSIVEVRTALDLKQAARAFGRPYGVGTPGADPQRAFRRCEAMCIVAGVAKPLGFIHLASPLFDEDIDDIVTYGTDPSLAAGTLNVDVHIARAPHEPSPSLDPLGPARRLVPALHFRSRVEGATWAGALGTAEPLPFQVPSFPARPPTGPAAEEYGCLERLQRAVIEALRARERAPAGTKAPGLSEARATIATETPCLTDPELIAEAEAYRLALASP